MSPQLQGPVGVLGMGQIGGSLCRALLAQGVAVHGYDLDPATRSAAARDGVAVLTSAAALFASCGLVVLAVPLDQYAAVADAVLPLPAGDGPRVLIDVGSSSVPLRAVWGGAAARGSLAVVGTHPMAGTERSGYAAADARLFDGCTWAVLHAAEGGPGAAVELAVVEWVLARGARALLVDATRHDDAVARISHLPHLLAGALVQSALGPPDAALHRMLAAGSFRDGTRVMHSDPGLVAAMCNANAAALLPVLDACIDWLADCRDRLDCGDVQQLRRAFAQAHALKTAAAHPAAAIDPVVEAADAAGLHALLLQACGAGRTILTLTPAARDPGSRWRALTTDGGDARPRPT